MMVHLAPDLTDRVCLGIVRADGVTVRTDARDVWAEIDRLAPRLRERFAGKAPGDIAELQPARELYRRTGEDPTKLRPSSEALLRRILRGESLYRINSLVDTCNLCSLDFLLPIGLYDGDRIAGDVAVRIGQAGDGYESLGKGFYGVGGRLALYDREGPFGNPTNDSRRTAITGTTTRCLMVVFAPGAYPATSMRTHVASAGGRLTQLIGAAAVAVDVIGGAA